MSTGQLGLICLTVIILAILSALVAMGRGDDK